MPRRDEFPDDAMIHAWLDGELGAVEAARVERLVAEDAEWAAAAAEARGLIAASSRILAALDVVAGDVIPRGGSAARVEARPFDGSRASPPRVTRRLVPTWMRIAAGFVLVAGVAYLGRDRVEMETAPGERRENAVGVVGDVASAVTPSAVTPSAVTPSALISPIAAAAPSASAPTQPATVEATSVAGGVAGGVASGLVSRPTPEAAATAAASGLQDLAKTTLSAIPAAPSARMARALEGVTVTGVTSADRAVEVAERRTITTDCWRTQSAARVDTIQTTLRVVRTEGDTLVVALTPAGAEARVVRESETVLRGTARGVSGPPAAFRAERTRCAP